MTKIKEKNDNYLTILNLPLYINVTVLQEACMSTKGWTRVIVEKPFGKVINKTLDMNKLAIIYPLVIWTPLCSVYHCILDAAIFWIPLYSGYNCILDTTVFWIQMYSGYKCILDTTVFWIQLYSGYNCILDTTVFWIPLYIL